MFGMKKRIEREILLKARIKELENIICPNEVHDYVKVAETINPMDCYGTLSFLRRYVCKRCLKAVEKDEWY